MAQPAREQVRHGGGQMLEGRGRLQQGVEYASVSSASASASRSAWVRRPRMAAATLPTWLRDQPQPARRGTPRRAVPTGARSREPARLDDARLEAGAVERQAQPGLGGGGVHHQFLLGGGVGGGGEPAAQAGGEPGARGIDVHQRDGGRPGCAPAASRRAARPRRRRSRRMRSPASGAASQTMFSAVSMLAASTARGVGTASGTAMHIADRGIEDVLVRMQHEHARAGLVGADGAVAVFHRERESAAHQRRAHRLVLARRHPAGEHRASVPREMPLAQHAHPAQARSPAAAMHFAADFAAPRRHGPERARRSCPARAARYRAAVIAEAVHRPVQPHAVLRAGDTGQREGGNAGAEQQRRDGHMQPVERSRRRETATP